VNEERKVQEGLTTGDENHCWVKVWLARRRVRREVSKAVKEGDGGGRIG
jgi:transglutaminase-like putative cysteine protease